MGPGRPRRHRGGARVLTQQPPAPTLDYLAALREIKAPAQTVLRAVTTQLAHHLVKPGESESPPPESDLNLPPLPKGLASPWLLGQAREVLHDRGRRTALGAWFTPAALTRHLLGTIDTAAIVTRILDPSCGGGAFLLAAHERFPAAHLAGVDVDPLAVEVTRTALELAGSNDHVIGVGDGLGPTGIAGDGQRYDLVVGNPPFLSQLHNKTARDADRRRWLLQRFGNLAVGYADEAALFVLAAARDLLTPGGSAVLIVPESLMAARDTEEFRHEVSRHCTVEVVWRDTDGVFPGTPSCAVRLTQRNNPRPSDPSTSWASLLADDVPPVTVQSVRTIRQTATATADFREAYYLLASHIQEEEEEEDLPPGSVHRIATVGLIDPANMRWGERPIRFAKQRWQRPVAVGLPADFVSSRTGPKILVATQSKVLEAVVDSDGDLIPSTPVITVRTEHLWHVGAALTSPVLTAIAARRHAGAARSRGAIKLSAKQILDLPLPEGPSPAWDQAAQLYREAHGTSDPSSRRELLRLCGALMIAAYEIDDSTLLTWWADRLPLR